MRKKIGILISHYAIFRVIFGTRTIHILRQNILDIFDTPFFYVEIPFEFFEIWIFFIQSENSFQTWTLWSCVMCVFSSLSRGKVEYVHITPLHGVHVWNRFSDRTNFFQIWIRFSNFKLYLRFQINSNGFSRDRSFGHQNF